MLREDPVFYLPNMLFFQNGNGFLGSYRGLRFLVRPGEQEDGLVFHCLDWYDEYALEESQVVSTAVFPMTDGGREQVIDWLDAEYAKMLEAVEETD